MDKTGSLIRLLAVSAVDWNNRQQIMETEAHHAYTRGLKATLDIFKNIGKSRNLDLIVQSEELMVLRERELHGHEDSAVLPSLNAAVTDFEVIKSSMITVKTPAEYQAAASTYHTKKKSRGVVADGCHEALNSHITRLGNRMSSVGVSIPEKNIIRQRQANMRVGKELYVELQRDALGINP